MEQIYDCLDGIENVVQQLNIKSTESNIKCIQALINTVRLVRTDLQKVEQEMTALKRAMVKPVEQDTDQSSAKEAACNG